MIEPMVVFLRARLDETAQAAKECAKTYPSPWDVTDRGHCAYVTADAPAFRHVTDLDQQYVPQGQHEWLGDALVHIARHDPARVLADVAAKRAILDLHAAGHECSVYDHRGEINRCAWVLPDEVCSTVQLLALPFAEHPDFDPAWTVEVSAGAGTRRRR